MRTLCTGSRSPGQFGPISRASESRITARTRNMSRTGTCSVIAQMSWMPASIASRIASAAPAGGTKSAEAVAPVSLTASRHVWKTGTPQSS